MKKLFYLLIVLSLIACKSTKEVQEVPVEVEKVHTEYITNTIRDTIKLTDSIYTRDSVYLRDSIYVILKGDTICYYNTKVEYRYKNFENKAVDVEYRDRIDTVIVRDTVPQVTTVTKEVTKEVNKIYWWQKVLMWVGSIMSICAIVYIALKIKSIIK